jgi:hypothetical protein
MLARLPSYHQVSSGMSTHRGDIQLLLLDRCWLGFFDAPA